MDLFDRTRDHVLALFRIVIGFIFVLHGVATLFDVMTGPRGGKVPEFASWPSWWAAAIQLVAGTLVVLGLGTRYAALLCSGSMAYAYFTVHQARALFPIENGGEIPALFAWSFLLIAVFGPGKWAIDELFSRSRRKEAAAA
ncbi:putative oxidoreductase [Actinokineospora baliensis]|uniref:DoxX family protein n=1 Tax=Actinokineospora baliensis TaxID=547056 RepID=UPI00195DC0E5|nr:DoxX family protein [Actinokineospora baliensis]MBM7771051.1 putative oxidoreductase [Actinokineospora baliensis]